MSKVRLFIWAILVVEAAAVVWLQAPWMYPDSSDYLSIASGDLARTEVKGPGYPLFLSLMPHPAVAVIVQMGLYLASIGIVGSLLPERARTTFFMLTAVYVFPFFYVAALLSEGLAIFLVAVTVTLLVRANSLWRWAAVGAVAGLSVLVRSDLLPIFAAVVAVALYRHQRRGAFASVLAGFFVLLPYMSWNAQYHGRFTPVPVNTALGHSLYIATWEPHLPAEDLFFISGGPTTPAAEQSGYAAEVRAIWARGGTSEDFMNAALDRVKAQPLEYVAHTVRAVWRLFNTRNYPAPELAVFGLTVISGAIWLLGMAGIGGALFRRSNFIPAAVFFAPLLPHLFMHTEARYTAPIRLILLYYAAQTVTRMLHWQFGNRRNGMRSGYSDAIH